LGPFSVLLGQSGVMLDKKRIMLSSMDERGL
jgi:hypothetical protein